MYPGHSTHTPARDRADGNRRFTDSYFDAYAEANTDTLNRGDDTLGRSIGAPLFIFFECRKAGAAPRVSLLYRLPCITLFGFQRLKGLVHD
jgi:hypothetical protein